MNFKTTLIAILIFAIPSLGFTQESKNTPSESKPSTTQYISEALLLVEIYGKIQQLTNSSNLKDQTTKKILEGVNQTLDRALDFKNSFTPEKKQKMEKQIRNLQANLKNITDSQIEMSKKSFSQLSDGMLELLKVFLEAKDENGKTIDKSEKK